MRWVRQTLRRSANKRDRSERARTAAVVRAIADGARRTDCMPHGKACKCQDSRAEEKRTPSANVHLTSSATTDAASGRT